MAAAAIGAAIGSIAGARATRALPTIMATAMAKRMKRRGVDMETRRTMMTCGAQSDSGVGHPVGNGDRAVLFSTQTALVVSGQAGIRAEWAAELEGYGYSVTRCPGPDSECALSTHPTCPLHRQARFAVYDERSLTPELLSALFRHSTATRLLVARDRLRSDGRHEPMLVRPSGPAVPLRWALAVRPADVA